MDEDTAMKKREELERITDMIMLTKMDRGGARMIEYEQLVRFTENFSKENFIATFQFGKVYRAKLTLAFQCRTRDVIVKTWEAPETSQYFPKVHLRRMMHEYTLLRHEKLIEHPGMIELYGICWDGEHLGAVYYFSPLDTVYNLVPKDSFTWLQRIKVALGFARLLKFLHAGIASSKPFLVRNIAVAHLLVDQEYNPKLCDFGMITGGIIPDNPADESKACCGYVDPSIRCSGKWSRKTDVFAFGIVLLNLITKRLDTEEEEDRQSNVPLLYCWAWDLFESCESENGNRNSTHSLVDQSLTTDPDFTDSDGHEITNLAMKCINRVVDERPTMKQVVKYLMKLQVTKKHVEFLGLASKQ